MNVIFLATRCTLGASKASSLMTADYLGIDSVIDSINATIIQGNIQIDELIQNYDIFV